MTSCSRHTLYRKKFRQNEVLLLLSKSTDKQRLDAIHILKNQHSIKKFSVLNVNRSTYYTHFDPIPSPRSIENEKIKSHILDLYNNSKYRLDVIKLQQLLLREYSINISTG